MGCSGNTCKLEEKVNGHHASLYGKNGLGGIVAEQGHIRAEVEKKADKEALGEYMKKIPIAAKITIAICLISFVIPGVTSVYTQQKINPHKYADKEKQILQEEKQRQLEEAVEKIQDAVDKMEQRDRRKTQALEIISKYIEENLKKNDGDDDDG